MARTNKAERFVKSVLIKKFGFYIKRGLPYDKDRASNEVYWAVCTHLGNPDHWPSEYTDAYRKLCW